MVASGCLGTGRWGDRMCEPGLVRRGGGLCYDVVVASCAPGSRADCCCRWGRLFRCAAASRWPARWTVGAREVLSVGNVDDPALYAAGNEGCRFDEALTSERSALTVQVRRVGGRGGGVSGTCSCTTPLRSCRRRRRRVQREDFASHAALGTRAKHSSTSTMEQEDHVSTTMAPKKLHSTARDTEPSGPPGRRCRDFPVGGAPGGGAPARRTRERSPGTSSPGSPSSKKERARTSKTCDTLIELNLALVRYAAGGVSNSNCSDQMEDIVQVGTIGLDQTM